MNKEKKATYRRTLTLGVLTRFVVACVLFTIGSFVALFLGMFICYAIPWNGGLIYGLLITVRDNVTFFMVIFLVGGYIVIFLIYWGKTLGYLGDVVRATEQIYKGGDGPVVLPAALHDIENQMNQIKSDMLASRRAAEDAEKRKNDLVVYLAHDLKTPLTSVIGYLSLLQDERDLPEAQRAKYTGIALDKAERLEDLINEFFEITRFNLSTVTLDYSSIDLVRLLEQLRFEFMPMLKEKSLTCTLCAPDALPISCDAGKMQRVFDNLLRNAVLYSYPDTEIVINAQLDGDSVSVSVVNRGNTIPEEKLRRIFEQFYRLDSARSSSGGAGLGLAIASNIVTLHGGKINARSADETVEFTVTLPVRKS